MDVVFLNYANSTAQPLPTLQEEDDGIYRALIPRALSQHFLLHRDPFASVERMAEYLTLFREYLSIFHYGGHAGRDRLQFGGQAAHGAGIARLLGQCPRLKVVVLNGCATHGQVKGLLDAGVPVVIASSAPVKDDKAASFGIRLFKALAEQASIGEAFELAIGEWAAHDPSIEEKAHRGLLRSGKGNEPAWGIYYRPGQEEALNHKLPRQAAHPLPAGYTINQRLTEVLWERLKPYVEEIRESKPGLSDARRRMAILNSLPAPVSEHLRKLLVPVAAENEGYDKVSAARLQQVVRAYQTIMELMAFTMLAQLWDIRFKKGALKWPPGREKMVAEFLNRRQDARELYDYLGLIRYIREGIALNHGSYFVEELQDVKNLLYQEGPFQDASFFLETLRVRLHRYGVDNADMEELCIRAEESLARLMGELAFMARYALLTVQQINVLKYRHSKEAEFRHIAVILRDLLGGLEGADLDLKQYMDSQSILLYKEDTGEYLNLSPFIIDANAFVPGSDKCKLYFVSHYEPGGGAYCFKNIYKPDDEDALLRIPRQKENKMYIVSVQFDAFQKMIRE